MKSVTVAEYEIQHAHPVIRMPRGARLMQPVVRGTKYYLVALVNPDESASDVRTFHVAAPGSRVSADAKYVGSVPTGLGSSLHFFEIT